VELEPHEPQRRSGILVWAGFDETRGLGGIVQSGAYFVDGGAQTVIEIDKGVRWPQPLANLLPGDNLARALEKHRQQIKGLGLQAYLMTVAAQLTGVEVCSKRAEENNPGRKHGFSCGRGDVKRCREDYQSPSQASTSR
jgi:hypothetical protein